ncbi:SUMF1/EgtB/PvdO family nonheme iron enzyme [bacterium]|nr:SUMF1/EgtB/PvdO family nonheme iron enzyme [bacterium]
MFRPLFPFRAITVFVVTMLIPLSASVTPAAEPSAGEMKSYTQEISGTDVSFDMVAIPGGEFVMGSPATEANRKDDEGPQVRVKLDPFWIGKHEVTWQEYDIWSYRLDIQRRNLLGIEATPLDANADPVTRPTAPYTDMTFGMGHDDYPAISMTQHAAKMYCRWLSEKTGHYYRLPTEAEWEYACRAGTTTAYSFGNDPDKLGEYGWCYDNSDEAYHKVGQKKPNPWGLYDMHGNVSEWVLDGYSKDAYAKLAKQPQPVFWPYHVPTGLYPRIVRGGSWDDDPDGLRSAARFASSADWKIQDPQIPKSIWYHTDALHVGFRVVRSLKVPSAEERVKLKLEPEAEIAKEGRAG